MRQKRLLILATAVVLSLMCGFGFAQKVTLRFVDGQGGNDGILGAYKEIIALYEQQNPSFKVEYQQYTVTTLNEYLKPALAGGQAPDMMAIYAGPDAIEIVQAGALVDIKPFIDAEWKKWLGPGYNFKGTNMKGGIYLTPQDALTECVWYHKDMLKKMGWPAKSFTEAYSIDDYIQMVGKAKAVGMNVMEAGFLEPWCYFNPFFNFVHQLQPSESPDMVEQAMNGEISWKQDVFRKPLEAYVKMNKAGVWRPDALNMDYQVQAFGKWLEKSSIFMWAQGDWFAGSMKKEDNNPDNPSIGITQYPSIDPKSVVSYNKNFGSDIGLYSKSKNQKACLAFMKLTNSPQAAQIFIRHGVNPAAGVDPTNVPKTDNPVFNDCIKLYNSPGRFSEIIYFNPQAVKAIGDGIGNVVLGVQKPDEVLNDLDKITSK